MDFTNIYKTTLSKFGFRSKQGIATESAIHKIKRDLQQEVYPLIGDKAFQHLISPIDSAIASFFHAITPIDDALYVQQANQHSLSSTATQSSSLSDRLYSALEQVPEFNLLGMDQQGELILLLETVISPSVL